MQFLKQSILAFLRSQWPQKGSRALCWIHITITLLLQMLGAWPQTGSRALCWTHITWLDMWRCSEHISRTIGVTLCSSPADAWCVTWARGPWSWGRHATRAAGSWGLLVTAQWSSHSPQVRGSAGCFGLTPLILINTCLIADLDLSWK